MEDVQGAGQGDNIATAIVGRGSTSRAKETHTEKYSINASSLLSLETKTILRPSSHAIFLKNSLKRGVKARPLQSPSQKEGVYCNKNQRHGAVRTASEQGQRHFVDWSGRPRTRALGCRLARAGETRWTLSPSDERMLRPTREKVNKIGPRIHSLRARTCTCSRTTWKTAMCALKVSVSATPLLRCRTSVLHIRCRRKRN